MGKYKDKHGKSRFGNFIKKAGSAFPEILDVAVEIGTGDIIGAIEEAGDFLKNKSRNSTGEEKSKAQELLNEFELKKMEFINDAFRIEVEDRRDARNLYKQDSLIQKIFAVAFLIGYGFLSWYLLEILRGSIEENELFKTMVTMIWTGTSTKLGTIIDFLFGGAIKKD